jgi:hypothetical protein
MGPENRKKEIMEELADIEVLEEMGSLNLEQSIRRMEINVELFKIMEEEEELYRYKRSRETWLFKVT